MSYFSAKIVDPKLLNYDNADNSQQEDPPKSSTQKHKHKHKTSTHNIKKIDLAIAKLEVLASLNNGRPTGDVLDEVISMLKNISLN
jgi:hypothetical protein